jgi:hypothetical protein
MGELGSPGQAEAYPTWGMLQLACRATARTKGGEARPAIFFNPSVTLACLRSDMLGELGVGASPVVLPGLPLMSRDRKEAVSRASWEPAR